MSAILEYAAPDVRINGQLAEVRFDRFGLDAYAMFLRCKALPESQLAYDWAADTYTLTTPARYAARLGVQGLPDPPARLPYPTHPFDYQRFVLDRALDAKRFAVWLDTGLGKTVVMLELVRQAVRNAEKARTKGEISAPTLFDMATVGQ